MRHSVAPEDPTLGDEVAEVVASRVVFGRRVGGIDVVGPGSKVAVTFANDGAPVAVSFDWPEYAKSGRQQEIQDIAGIRARANALASAAVLGASRVELRRFECGYYDLGIQNDLDAREFPIQAACDAQFVTYRSIGKDEVFAGQLLAIPAGRLVEEESPIWREATLLRTLGESHPAGSRKGPLFQ